MVRIRKKTSNRMTTAHRAKIKHKARETKKKNKKVAKKNPNLHKKKKKDPGIPNSFPFKEQILAEVAESRRLAIEEKRRKEELGRSKATPDEASSSMDATITVPIAVITGGSHGPTTDTEAPPLIDTSVPHTAAALNAADVVLYILDARDPLSYRSAFIENTVGEKPMLYILNKIDLAPREAVSAWAKALREHYPALYFRSSTSNLLAEDAQRVFAISNVPVNGKSKLKASESDSLGREAILEALQSVLSKLGKSELSIAVVGMTNVGKSALINSLLRKSVMAVYNPSTPRDRDGTAPSTTLYPQCVTLTHKKRILKFIDTPGLSFIPPPRPDSMEDAETRIARDVLLRNRGNISKIKDPLPAALYLLSRAVMEDLLMLYNLPAVQAGDYDAFLSSLARKEGALQKRGAVIDFQGAAKALVRDWKTGRLARYTLPSNSTAEASKSKSTLDLSSIYLKSDESLLSQVLLRRELRKQRTLVQLKDAVLDERKVDLESVQMVEDSETEDSDDGDERDEMDEDDDEDEDDGESTDEEDVDEDTSEDSDTKESSQESHIEPPIAVPTLSGKKKREALRVEQGRHVGKGTTKSSIQRSVSFAPYTKAGAKAKPRTINSEARAFKSNNVPVMTRKKVAETGDADTDAYDFTKYF